MAYICSRVAQCSHFFYPTQQTFSAVFSSTFQKQQCRNIFFIQRHAPRPWVGKPKVVTKEQPESDDPLKEFEHRLHVPVAPVHPAPATSPHPPSSLLSHLEEQSGISGLNQLSARSISLRGTSISKNGDMSHFVATKSELASRLSIPLRELRLVDRQYRSQFPAILPRSSCALVYMKQIRAIISPTEVLVFDTESVQAHIFIASLQKVLNQPLDQPFEFRVLETIFSCASSSLDRDLMVLLPAIQSSLSALAKDASSSQHLQELLKLKKALETLLTEVKEIASAFRELLENDEDMAALYLSESKERKVEEHVEVETLLELYLKDVQNLESASKELKQNIESSQDTLALELDAIRNRMMRLELQLGLGTCSFAFGSMWSSIFGMNLLSGMENNPNMFWMMSSGIVASSATIFAVAYIVCKRRKIL